MRLARHRSVTVLRIALLSIAPAYALAGCGDLRTVSFTRAARTLHLRVGDQIGVRKSVGECGSPWSTNLHVIAALNPPRQGDCSRETVRFKAVGAGTARITGQLPCHFTECMAMGAWIPVVVTGA